MSHAASNQPCDCPNCKLAAEMGKHPLLVHAVAASIVIEDVPRPPIELRSTFEVIGYLESFYRGLIDQLHDVAAKYRDEFGEFRSTEKVELITNLAAVAIATQRIAEAMQLTTAVNAATVAQQIADKSVSLKRDVAEAIAAMETPQDNQPTGFTVMSGSQMRDFLQANFGPDVQRPVSAN